jgi:hypothetical protein
MAAGSIAVFQGDAGETMSGRIRAVMRRAIAYVSQSPSNVKEKGQFEVSGPALAQHTGPLPAPGRDSGSAASSLVEVQSGPSVEKIQAQQPFAAEKPDTAASKQPAPTPDFSSGMIRVEVKPSTATVLVDDKKLTPEEVAGVKLGAGIHTLLARADGFAPSTTLVNVSGNDTHLVMIGLTPAEKTGELEVLSDLAAEMYIDGVYKGNAPTAGPIVLSEGQHTVVFKRQGFKPYVKMVSIRQGETKKIKVESGTTSSR